MKQILRCDWLPERARWSYLALSGLPAVSRKENFPKSQYNKSSIDQACLVKTAGYWPRSYFFFCCALASKMSFYVLVPITDYRNTTRSYRKIWSVRMFLRKPNLEWNAGKLWKFLWHKSLSPESKTRRLIKSVSCQFCYHLFIRNKNCNSNTGTRSLQFSQAKHCCRNFVYTISVYIASQISRSVGKVT